MATSGTYKHLKLYKNTVYLYICGTNYLDSYPGKMHNFLNLKLDFYCHDVLHGGGRSES